MNGLVVDDDVLYARTLQRSLERRHVQLRVAHDGASALAVAQTQAPDFVLLDLIAPLRELGSQFRIILMTGYASVATAVDAIKRGADDYLAKPVGADALLRVLHGVPDVVETAPTMTPLGRLEWEHIQQALHESRGNIAAAARLLGMHRRSLQRKLFKRPGPERPDPDSLDG